MSKAARTDALGQEVHLSWGEQKRIFRAFEMPVHIGRIRQCDFVVADPRVSRTHSRLEWRHGRVLLVDVSSYGTWIRFVGARSDLLLRREECVLHGKGQIALGAAFSDATAPLVSFEVG